MNSPGVIVRIVGVLDEVHAFFWVCGKEAIEAAAEGAAAVAVRRLRRVYGREEDRAAA